MKTGCNSMAMDKIPIMTTARGSERALRSRKKRQVKKCRKLQANRYWEWVVAGEKRARIFTFFENVLGPNCLECSDILGEGWACKTCIASLPELTPVEKAACDLCGEEIAKLFIEVDVMWRSDETLLAD